VRVISKPNISPIRTYVRCYSSFRITTKIDFSDIARFINSESVDYDQKAYSKNLYTFSIHTFVQGNISKDHMVKLYKKMVGHPRGRKVYDKLMSLAPLSRCPFCGIGMVTTLDHYLPEAKFPTFSVLPYNLVASCKDCNTGKLASYATTQNTQTLHPYYDDFTSEQWLYARVLQPLKIEFYVNPPVTWSQVDKDRVQEHFKNYKLSTRFSVEASNVLATLSHKFTQYSSSSTDIKNELEKEYKTHKDLHLNSWETAMYQALYLDSSYCNGGFR
jgi:hypothetical protein